MKIIYSYTTVLLLISLLTRALPLHAQDKQVNGFVMDASTGKAMPYVNIAVVGSTYGTVSNQNGEFTINLNKTNESDSICFHYSFSKLCSYAN
jgi:hypothetical protein